MKKLATLAAGLLAATAMMAQPAAGTFSITPKVGIGASTLSNDAYGRMYTIKTGKHSTQFVKAETEPALEVEAGVELGYQLPRRFGLSAGVFYAQQGAKREKSGGWNNSAFQVEDKSHLDLDYINIPVLANFYVWRGLTLKVGLQAGILLAAEDHIDVNGGASADGFSDHRTLDVKSQCNPVDIAIPVGIAYEFDSGIMLEGRANLGVNDLYKHSHGCNVGLQLTIGYKFKMGKKR